MQFSDTANGAFLVSEGAATRFAATLLVSALLMRFSGPSAVRLRYWGAAWLGLTLQVVGSVAYAANRNEAPFAFYLGATVFSVGAYGYLLGLILGVSDLPEQRSLSFASRRALTVVAVALTILTLIGFYIEPLAAGVSFALRQDLLDVSRVLACAIVAFRLARDHPPIATGRWLVLLSLLLQVAQSLTHLGLRLGPGSPSRDGLSGAVALGLMGLGMIACLLDDDRQALARASAEARRASTLDPLTGLSNKTAFVHDAGLRLAPFAADGAGFGIVFLALNRLGAVNQTLGHGAGDRVLRACAERLRLSLRVGDDVGRVGGDEFAVLVADVSEREDLLAVAHKLQETMRRPFEVDGRELSVTASVGVSLYPQDAFDPGVLLDQACTAAHRVKDRVGGRVGVYSKGMNADALERLSLEHDLRKAIERDELVLYYQPIFRLPGTAVRGFEALLRWRHPRVGLLGADVIVPLAEATGLIHAIGSWVLRTACGRVQGLRRLGQESLVLSANVSAHQLMASELTDHVEAALQESGLPPSHLEVEVTETAAIDNFQTARQHLLALKAMGVSIAIDDFGTGYSSLSYLRSLPLDTIKIDRSFIRDVGVDLSDGTLVTTIIALAQGRDLRVIAEGVETEDQLRFLVSRGCDYAQGYLLACPLPPEALDDWGPVPLVGGGANRMNG